ncbi:BA75_02874T0 [Komagataella pastoris]|uniref:BA75_02874T0 n=1 Tax=Komagataella pastoris TaxID=4922 RepID=A0A1B2JD62_PICPA|nr:BA75_02874T0 [Komagataella pastoris]
MSVMKALVYGGKNVFAWKNFPKPTILHSTDVIVKTVATTICGTDLHILKGDVPEVKPETVLGHEAIGVVESIGESVKNFNIGDKVLVSCITSCGSCYYCKRNLQSHCKTGGWKLGHDLNGTQAEFVRIPYGDYSLHRIPHDADEKAVLMLSDILPTAYEVGVLAGNVQKGDSVAIVGAGPVGLAALLTVKAFEPSEIIMIDTNDERLGASLKLGATKTVNPTKVSSVKDAVYDIVNATVRVKENDLEPGVDVAIECVGVPDTFATCEEIIAPGGRIANVGVHGTKVDLQLQDLWIKNIAITTGLVATYSTKDLLKRVSDKSLDPTPLVTHEFKFSEFEKAYETSQNAATTKAIKIFLSAD